MKGKLLRSALMASAAVLISTGGGLVLSSCIEIGSSDSSSGGEVKKEDLYAVVQGVVKDDNGKPVVGAKVTIGNLSTTTNEAGYYQFDKVPVTAVYGTEADKPTYDDIVIVIQAPEGSGLVDTIMVTAKPVAQQFDSTHNNESGTAVSNPNTTLVQLLAQAKTAVMAHKAASVHGVLRNSATGEPIPNALVRIAWDKTPGCELPDCQYQVDPVIVTTDENGTFSAEGLLTNTWYQIEVPGYSGSTTFRTSGKDVNVALGNVLVTPVVAADTIPPKIVVNPARYGGKVIGIMGTDLIQLSTPGGDFTGLLVLAPGVDGANQPIPVMFSEKMNTSIPLTPNESVVVYDETAKQIVNVTNLAWDADGKTLLITTSEPIPAGHDIYVRLRGYEFQDLAGNSLQVNPGNPPTNVISTASVSDELVKGPLGNKDDYVQIQYEVYDPTVAVVEPVSDLVQLDVPGADDNTADDDPNPFYSVDTVFENHKAFYDVDEDDTNLTVAQLNDPFITPATDDRICQLANQLNSNISGTNCISNNATKLAFTPVEGVNSYKVKRNGSDIATININTLTDTFAVIVPGLEARLSGGKVELRMTGVNVGDIIDVVSLNGFGDEATAASVILEDTVPPFTVVQSVPTGNPNVDVFGGAPPAGGGGNLVDVGVSAGGTGLPIFYIRADMYSKTASKIGDWTQLRGSDNYYNATNFADLVSTPRTLGVWFSEPLQDVAVRLFEGADDVTASLLTGTPSYLGLVGGSPLATFQVSDILEAQKLTKISFGGTTDNQGNAASLTSEGDLVVKDKMPPMLKKAYVNTSNPKQLVLEFSEDVQLFDYDPFGNPIGISNIISITGQDSSLSPVIFTFDTNASGNVSGFPAGAVNWYTDQLGRTLDPANTTITATVSGNTMTIEVTGKDAGGNDVDTSKFWEELIWAWDTNTEGDYHRVNGEIVFSKVPDVHGNDWTDSADNMGAPPQFAAEDRVYPRIAAGNNPINDATNPLYLAITDAVDDDDSPGVLPDFPADADTLPEVHNQDTASGGVGGNYKDGNWYVGDNFAGETFNLRIKFRERLADMDNDGDVDKNDLAAMGAGATFINGGANYTFPAQDYGNAGDGAKIDVIDAYTIEIHFDLRSGQTVTAGDEIKITNIKDDAGNTIPDFTIKLNAAGEGITVTNVAY